MHRETFFRFVEIHDDFLRTFLSSCLKRVKYVVFINTNRCSLVEKCLRDCLEPLRACCNQKVGFVVIYVTMRSGVRIAIVEVGFFACYKLAPSKNTS